MRALVLANGEPPPAALLRQRASECDLLVCCDGALQVARAVGVTPDLVLGDLDSLGERGDLAGAELLHLPEQETTDLEKACYTLLARGYSSALVLGARGRCADHDFAALSLCGRYSARLALSLEDAWGRLDLCRPGDWHALDAPAGATVSLLPWPQATGVRTTGLRWPLAGVTLAFGQRESISNEVVAAPARVWYAEGCLAVYRRSEP